MALVVNDRVKETSTTTGTGSFTLAGAVTGFETFSSAIGNTNTTYYAIVNTTNGEFEVGLGTVGAGTLSRDTIISSSNSDAAVDFAGGTKNVFCTLPASKSVILDASGNIVANNGSNLTNLNADNLASGTLPDARFPATLPAADGSALTALNATNIASGTLASDRLPTVPTTKGGTGLTTIGTANQVIAVNAGATALEYQTVDLTNLNADNLTSGTVPDARFPATLPAISGANLTNLDADDLASGTLPDARFPATLPAASGANLTSLNATNIASGTLASDRLPTVPTTKGGTGLTTIGSANQVLAVNGAGTALEYQTPTTGDITGVTAGNGLTGGGSSGDVTLNVGAGALIDVTADAIDVDLSELTTSTSDADGDFFAVIDSANAQKKLTKANINISGFNNDSGFIDGSSLNASNLDSGTVPNARLSAIPNTALANSAITINGTSTALGGSINVGDITGVTAGTLLDGGGTTGDVTLNVDLSELTTSTSDADGDFFVVVDSANAQKKLTKANIAISGFNNDSGFIDGSSLNASNLSSGTVPDARFPATLPAISGANLTNLDASDLASGTVPDARFPATLPAISGANLTNLDASDLASGTVPIARIDLNLLTTSTSNGDGDFFVVVDSVGAEKKLTKANIAISGFNNDSGFTTNTGTVTSVSGGNGLTGSVTTSGSLAVGAGTLIDVTADAVNVDLSELSTSTTNGDGDYFVVVDTLNAQRKLTKANINISGFNNDSGFTTNTGTVTSVGVSAGSGLTGGGTVTTSGTLTLNVGAGTGIDVAADAISVDVSDFMTNGSNNRVVTATGTDGMNAEANMTFDGSTLTVTGAITTTGNLTSDHVLPNANDTYDLGASGNVWRNIYTGDLHLSNEAKEEGNAVDGTKGNWTIQEGAEDLYILNNKSGKKYRFKLEEM